METNCLELYWAAHIKTVDVECLILLLIYVLSQYLTFIKGQEISRLLILNWLHLYLSLSIYYILCIKFGYAFRADPGSLGISANQTILYTGVHLSIQYKHLEDVLVRRQTSRVPVCIKRCQGVL